MNQSASIAQFKFASADHCFRAARDAKKRQVRCCSTKSGAASSTSKQHLLQSTTAAGVDLSRSRVPDERRPATDSATSSDSASDSVDANAESESESESAIAEQRKQVWWRQLLSSQTALRFSLASARRA